MGPNRKKSVKWAVVKFSEDRSGDIIHVDQVRECVLSELEIGQIVKVAWQQAPGAEPTFYEAKLVDYGSVKSKMEKILKKCLKRNCWLTDSEF